MTTTVSDYIDARQRIASLGCVSPSGIALLPDNLETAPDRTKLLMRAESATIKTLFRTSKVPLDEIMPVGERVSYVQNNSFEWVLPTIFISATLMAQSPDVVSVGMNVLSNYITDFLKGVSGKKVIKIDIIFEEKNGKTFKKIKYEGDDQGISAIVEIVKQIYNA